MSNRLPELIQLENLNTLKAVNECFEIENTQQCIPWGFPPTQSARHIPPKRVLLREQDYADDEPYRNSAEHSQDDVAPGVLTAQKFRELGTMEAVQQSRDRYLQEMEQLRQKTPAELAREHMNRMRLATKCSRPLPRVIHVSNETSKRYVPYCTILHRCGEDTGCCDTTRQVCTVKSYEDVEVYFFVITVNSGTNRRDTELLVLRNHTECHCVDRSTLTANYMQRDKRSGISLRRFGQFQTTAHHNADQPTSTNTACRCPRHFNVIPVASGDISHDHDDADDDEEDESLASMQRPRNKFKANCHCDCLGSNLPCQRLKNGEEGFALDDRICIAEDVCRAPTCSYGDYSRQTGRCPRSRNHERAIIRHNYSYG